MAKAGEGRNERTDEARPREERAGAGADPAGELTEGVSEVVSAALGVGASVARAFAEATSGGKPMRPPPGDRPLEVLVHYSLASATNVLGMMGGALGDAARMATGGGTKEGEPTPGETSAAGSEARGAVPVVAPGATLRLPLSVENPGPEPMRGLRVVCGSVQGEELGQGSPLGKRHVRFVPEVLDIAPRDFEKLTVFVQTEPDTAAGTYEAVIQMGSESFATPVRFRVERGLES